MLTGMIETHAHMDDPRFMADIEAVMKAEKERGVAAIVTSGSELASSARSVALADRFDFVYASVGIYPNETRNVPADYQDTLRALAKNKKVVAIGEIGLDYAFDPHYDKAQQEKYFRGQLDVARELGLPVVIHDRDADEDTLRIIKEYDLTFLIHRIFSEPKYAGAFTDRGVYLGIGPQITYPGSEWLEETVKEMPLELLVLETDAPFLLPFGSTEPFAWPSMMASAAEKIAAVRGDVTPQQVVDIAAANSRRLFSIR